jgi:HSP20 family protein
MSEEKKKQYYYYGAKEKKSSEAKEEGQKGLVPYSLGDIQRDFDRMIGRFERDFEDFWGLPSRITQGMRSRQFPIMPFKEMSSVDLEDREKEYCLTVDLPGFKKEDVDMEISDESLTISAKKSESKEDKGKNFVRKERRAQSFYRRILLPEKIRSDEAKASLNNGILEVTLPKKEPKETKKLKIS